MSSADIRKRLEEYLNLNEHPNSETSPNPLDQKEVCELLTTKKSEFYKFTYDPKHIIQKLKDNEISEDVLDRFDTERRDGCCNIITLSLYFKDQVGSAYSALKTFEKYIYSIGRTVKNVKINLPEWIVRVYLDVSVFKSLLAILDTITPRHEERLHAVINELTYEIMESPNVETYIYNCQSHKTHLDRTRTLRFMPIADSDVNICIVREADGIVSNVDCHNIKLFESMHDKLFYIVPFHADNQAQSSIATCSRFRENPTDITLEYNSYSSWLKIYKRHIESDFFREKWNLYDILAGTLGIRLKIKKEYLFKRMEKIQHVITLYGDPLLNSGFDEILLLDIFKEIISFEHKQPIRENMYGTIYDIKIPKDDKEFQKIRSLFSGIDVKTFEIDVTDAISYPNITIVIMIEKLHDHGLIRMYQPEIETFEMMDFEEKELVMHQMGLGLMDIENALILDAILNNDALILDEMFDIYVTSKESRIYISSLVNFHYPPFYNEIYDNIGKAKSHISPQSGGMYYYKYQKYKSKYLSLLASNN